MKEQKDINTNFNFACEVSVTILDLKEIRLIYKNNNQNNNQNNCYI